MAYIVSVEEALKLAPGLAFAATLACFSAGMLIVNVYLGTYGVYSDDFVRSEYILVGITFLVLLVGADFASRWAFFKISDGVARWKSRRYLAAIGSWLGCSFAAGSIIYLLSIISQQRLSILNWKTWATLGALIAFGGYVRGAVAQVNWFKSSQITAAPQKERWNALLEAFGAVPLLLLYIALYAQWAYPLISPTYGGGHRDRVVLVPTPRGLEVSKILALPLQSDGRSVGPVRMIAETSSELTVLADDTDARNSHAMQISRTLVEAIWNVAEPEQNK